MLKYTKILLVDDDADDRQIFQEIVRDLDPNAVVNAAENGMEMIAMLDRTPDGQLPEMIILDQNMPQMTGKESLIFLKQSPRFQSIPVIVYSTYQIRDFYQECLELGAQDVLPKPDTLQSYRDMIVQFLVDRAPSPVTQPPSPVTNPSSPVTQPPSPVTQPPSPVTQPPSPASEEHRSLPKQ